jgi:MtaA/CmuA family methyltransferase
MNGYERIMATLHGQKTDKIPLMVCSFLPAAAEAGLTMEEYRSSAKNMSRALIDFARKYDMDGIWVEVDTCMEAGAIGAKVELRRDAPAAIIGPAADNIYKLIDMMIPDKLHKYDRIKIQLEAVNLIKKEVGGEILLRGNCDQMAFSLAMLTYGMENFLADLTDVDLEENIQTLIGRAFEVHLEFHRMMKDAGADITSFGDSSCGPDVISRDMYLKFSKPYHLKLQKMLTEELKIPTVCHICGNLDRIIDDVVEIGFAGTEIDYKTNIPRAAELMRGKTVEFGPINPTGIFYFGTPEDMTNEVKRVLDYFNGKGIVLGSGCAIPKGAPEENFRAFVKAARNYTGT